MKSFKASLIAIVATVALTLSVSAQQSTTPHQQPNQGMQGMERMQGMQNGQHGKRANMMQGCQKNMQTMMQSNDQAQKEIAAAKQSNDPAKMRAALDTAEKALSGMNDHMKSCQSMMNMMQNMQGMGGMMMGGQQQQKPITPPKQ